MLDPETRRAFAARVQYYKDLGIYDFYRRPVPESVAQEREGMEAGEREFRKRQMLEDALADEANRDVASCVSTETIRAVEAAVDHAAALRAIREDLGDCKRCPLHKQGRKQIVFGVGNPYAELMFIGEAPGADEDEQGIPFVGRAGQLLTNMIAAMGLRRDDVYIANIIKCRPPGNRTPERDECATCSPFLLRQIDVIQPKVIVALGAVAARTLLGMNEPMAALRGRWFDFRGIPLAVTYHPAYLLRDPRQKAEAWKDLQMVMKRMGLRIPAKRGS